MQTVRVTASRVHPSNPESNAEQESRWRGMIDQIARSLENGPIYFYNNKAVYILTTCVGTAAMSFIGDFLKADFQESLSTVKDVRSRIDKASRTLEIIYDWTMEDEEQPDLRQIGEEYNCRLGQFLMAVDSFLSVLDGCSNCTIQDLFNVKRAVENEVRQISAAQEKQEKSLDNIRVIVEGILRSSKDPLDL